MNEEQLKRIMLQQNLTIRESAKQQVITEGKSLLEKQQYTRHSFFSLLGITLRFISVSIWVKQAALFAAVVGFQFAFQDGQTDWSVLLSSLTVFVLFSVLLFVDELLKSFSYGTWELEQTLKYNLDQQLLAKFLIFGLFELFFVTGVSLVGQEFLMLAFWKIILYLLVPLNCFTIVVLLVLTTWNSQSFRVLMWLVSGVSIALIWGLLITFDVYAASLSIWVSSFLATSVIAAMIILKSTRRIGREMT